MVSYTYDSWGKLLGIEGELKDTLGVKNPYRYKGYRYDNETGLYYLKSRYYNPDLGRFISADAMAGKTGEILSHNLFAYCGNNPVNAIDEDGNMFGWIRNAWNATKRAVVTGVRKIVSGVKRIASAVVSGVKRFVRSASNYVRNVYRGFTNTARRTYQRARRWVNNTGRSISRSVQNGAHRVIRQVRNIAQDKEKMEMIRTIVGIASIAAIAIPVVPAIAVAVLGVIEVGLDLAAGDNKSAAMNLLCLFPMGKGIKMVTGIGGDGLKGAREAKNLYKAEGLLKMDLQKFGKGVGKSNPLENIKFTDKVKAQMKLGDYHSFPESVEGFGVNGKITKITGGDKIVRTKIEIPGSYKGKDGIFEYIIESDGVTCNHRLFKPNK
nr:RHS repeat-associated core domain-containing protein [Clostridium sp. Marseille-Q2269]